MFIFARPRLVDPISLQLQEDKFRNFRYRIGLDFACHCDGVILKYIALVIRTVQRCMVGQPHGTLASVLSYVVFLKTLIISRNSVQVSLYICYVLLCVLFVCLINKNKTSWWSELRIRCSSASALQVWAMKYKHSGIV